MAGPLSMLLLVACGGAPPPPVGLDDSAHALVREFGGDDNTVSSELSGLLAWYDSAGSQLAAIEPSEENASGFLIGDLGADDVRDLGFAADGRDLKDANGAVGVASIDCTVSAAEALLIRSDQAVVFDDFDDYARHYRSDRGVYASGSQTVPEARRSISLDDDADAPDVMLRTDNDEQITVSDARIDDEVVRYFRHGLYTIDDVPTHAVIALSYTPKAAGDTTALQQSYAIEAIVARGNERTIRLTAAWTSIASPDHASEDPYWTVWAVDQSRRQASRLSSICRGETVLPPEQASD